MRYSLRTLIIVMMVIGAAIGMAVRVVLDGRRALQRTIEMTHESVKARQEEAARQEAEKILADRQAPPE